MDVLLSVRLFILKIIFIYFHLMLFISCGSSPQSNLEKALSLAKENRGELEKVLDHYRKNQEDSLKYRAACFLIENMPYYHYYEGEQLDNYENYYKLLSLYHDLSPSYLLDSITEKYGKFDISKLKTKYDINEVDSSYLCNNIEWSFKVWQESPWGHNVSFQEFCEFILPYRLGNEKLTYWKEELYHHFISLFEDTNIDDPVEAALILTDSLKKKPYRFTSIAPLNIPRLGPFVSQYLSGSCLDITDYTLYACRALGIPCHLDFMPTRGDENNSHFWISYSDKNGSLYVQDFLEYIMPVRSSHLREFNKLKVYRTTFSQNHNMKSEMEKLEKNIHPFFYNPTFVDVTVYYADCFAQVLKIPAEYLYSLNNPPSIAYLCLANRMDWIPITWTKYDDKDLTFHDLSKGSVMRVAGWQNNSLVFLSPPFLFQSPDGKLIFFSEEDSTQSVTLFSKTNLKEDELFLNRMLGGVFEGSHVKTFQEIDTLFYIKQRPYRLLNQAHINNPNKYRYVRYVGPAEGYCNVAEIAFYGSKNDSLPLSGKIIGTPGSWGDDKNHDYTNVFDGKTDTSFDYKEETGGWVGLDLGDSYEITKIVYTPRNRDNFIRPGDKYELFFAQENGWETLGMKIASSDSLNYENVPVNSLLYLRNHTRGVQERIFTYKNRDITWW